ncbi:MAG: DUF4412 domain-containing protein [Deltaproteobacteria bacterium]|nr:DUF4412 domain-containing protein [Deltaproteobacteria bacterium]
MIRRPLLLAVAAALSWAVPAAHAFDGTVTLRTMSVPRDQLAAANGGKAPDGAAAIFALMPAQLLAAKDAPEVRETKVYVSGAKVRMDAPLEKSKQGFALVDLDKGTTWFVVPEEKRYVEWSKDDAKAMGEKMVQVRKMLTERLAQMPPEQRKQAEQMLKTMPTENDAAAAPPPPIPLTALDKTQDINGMKSSAYEAKEGDTSVVGWVTQDQAALAAALRQVAQRMEQLTPANMRKATVRESLQAKGLPVMVQTLEPERYRIEEILKVESGKVPADLFTLPADYTRTTGRDAIKAMPTK